MDEFVVLTERYGLKPQRKSVPMASLKRSVNPNNGETWNFGSGDDVKAELTSNYSSKFSIGSKFDDFDELNKLSSNKSESIFSSVGELLGEFTGDSGKNEDGFDELIPGFPSNSATTTTWTVTPNDPFEVVESTLVHSSSGMCVDTLDSDNASKYKEAEDIEEMKPAGPVHLLVDSFPLFGADPFLGEFEELPGESDKRRMARWEREQRMKNQQAKAVDDMNKRDRQIQFEQEERNRISETLDTEIKHWAAGKEGNIRALLSSLHLVLWPGCGWEAVSLIDLITSASVKKVYKKANLYVHPDKVQQKGARQKYIAEKVFNILQEAWNKFNIEERRIVSCTL